MVRGLYDAELGGNLYKKRISRNGFGKRSSYRTIIATKSEDRWIFMFGFAKNEKDNITNSELKAAQRYAKLLLNYTKNEIDDAVLVRDIIEVDYEKK